MLPSPSPSLLQLLLLLPMMMMIMVIMILESVGLSVTMVHFYQTTRRYVAEESILLLPC
jgi:hypothetical protein